MQPNEPDFFFPLLFSGLYLGFFSGRFWFLFSPCRTDFGVIFMYRYQGQQRVLGVDTCKFKDANE